MDLLVIAPWNNLHGCILLSHLLLPAAKAFEIEHLLVWLGNLASRLPATWRCVRACSKPSRIAETMTNSCPLPAQMTKSCRPPAQEIYGPEHGCVGVYSAPHQGQAKISIVAICLQRHHRARGTQILKSGSDKFLGWCRLATDRMRSWKAPGVFPRLLPRSLAVSEFATRCASCTYLLAPWSLDCLALVGVLDNWSRGTSTSFDLVQKISGSRTYLDQTINGRQTLM